MTITPYDIRKMMDEAKENLAKPHFTKGLDTENMKPKCEKTSDDILLCILYNSGLRTIIIEDEVVPDLDGSYMILHIDPSLDHDGECQIGSIRFIDSKILITDVVAQPMWELGVLSPIYMATGRPTISHLIDLTTPDSLEHIKRILALLVIKFNRELPLELQGI